jgi:hypothetical protein
MHCCPSYVGSCRRIVVQGQAGVKEKASLSSSHLRLKQKDCLGTCDPSLQQVKRQDLKEKR